MEKLTSRERVIRALNHQETDRVPIDIGGISNLTTMHKNAYKKLQNYFGREGELIKLSSSLSQSVEVDEWVRKKFHADCYPVYITGPNENELKPNIDEDGSVWFIDEWGIKWKCPSDGLYYEPIDPPLKELSLKELENYPWPDPDSDKNIEGLSEKVRDIYENTEYAIVCGGPLYGGVFVPAQQMIGYEEFFVKLLIEPEFCTYVMNKIVDYHIGQWGKILEQCGECIQVAVMGDHLGTQFAPLMNLDTYRELIKPLQKKVVDFIKSKAPHIKIVFHCDGAIRSFLPDMIDVGFDAWNPIQVSADGIDDTKWLAEQYGEKICFWGGSCDSQTILATATPEEIKEEVERRINDMGHRGGLVMSSIHNLQENIPIENIIALYEAFYEKGVKFYEQKRK